MALVLCKGKPYSPPTLHGYAFQCMAPENEFPGPDALWGSDVKPEDFHKFLIGVEGSPFWLEDKTVDIPPPPDPSTAVVEPALKVPGAVPSTDPEAAVRLQLAAAASGALEPVVPGPGPDVPPPGDPAPDARAEAYAPFAALRSKAEIAALAKASYGMEMDPENSKMADMLEAVKAEIATRIPPPAPQV